MAGPKKSGQPRPATLADVGLAAGVSAAAASLVLNGSETSARIAAATRKRILDAAAALRYRPNAAARALVNRRMNTIGVVGVLEGGVLSSYFLHVFNGMLSAAGQHQQSATVFSLPSWQSLPTMLPRICDGRIDGVVLIAPRTKTDILGVLPSHTPLVALQANLPIRGVLNILAENEGGAYDMVRHLIGQGHRRIMHVSGDPSLIEPRQRIAGYKRALAEAGIPFDPQLLVHAEFSTASGRAAMRAWLHAHPGQQMPQAIFCTNDSVAIGCLEVLAEFGLRAPDDVSVAGFDDSLFALTTVPQLTSVRQPLRLMGQRTVEELLKRITHERDNPDAPPLPVDPIVYPTEVMFRGSVAAPPKAARLVPRAI